MVFNACTKYHNPIIGADNPDKADVIIIPGYRLNNDGSLKIIGKLRSEWGVLLLNNGYGKKLLFTGGNPKNGIPEARAMKKYSIENFDIESTNIIIETNSTSSEENAKYSMPIIHDLGYSSVLVSTSKVQLIYCLYKFKDAAYENNLILYWKYFDLYELYYGVIDDTD